MGRIIKKSPKKVGASPGTLMHIGKKYKDNVEITLIEYGVENVKIRKIENIEECFQNRDTSTVKWLNIECIHDIDVIDTIGKGFNLHPLLLEDVLNTGQRAKVDDYDNYIFIVLKMLSYDDDKHEIVSEQISLVIIDNYVLSFQEIGGDVFDNVRVRIKAAKGNIRKFGTDYLLYALIDAIVDSYFVILEKLGSHIDDIEDKLMDSPGEDVLQSIHSLKREMLFLRTSIWPLREVISTLVRGENKLLNDTTVVYFRDVYDHIIQVIDTIEVYRDILSGMLDTYLSSISNKTNDIMKILTILSTIFIPITFVAGVYGMNFDRMPELRWKWGYGFFWISVIAITFAMLRFFRKKRWI
jgi:magnesium transporter